jgi:hypothetical protein
MHTVRRAATVLLWPTIAWLGAACDRLDPPTAGVQFSIVGGEPGKVTGGGQINILNATGATIGTASFGFNAKHEESEDGTEAVVSGRLNYVNHVSGVHLNCEVESGGVTPAEDDIPAGGTFGGYDCTPSSTFSNFTITVFDQGEPGRTDEASDVFTIEYVTDEDITIIEGGPIRSGNIQVHKTQEPVGGSE